VSAERFCDLNTVGTDASAATVEEDSGAGADEGDEGVVGSDGGDGSACSNNWREVTGTWQSRDGVRGSCNVLGQAAAGERVSTCGTEDELTGLI